MSYISESWRWLMSWQIEWSYNYHVTGLMICSLFFIPTSIRITNIKIRLFQE